MFALVRWRFCPLQLAAAISFLLASHLTAQDFVSVDSLAKGLSQVAQSDKLLVVIQSTGDFTQAPFSLPTARTFELLTLRDPAVAKASQSRCVFVCQAIARPFSSIESARSKESNLQVADNVVTYFCSPEGFVLHFLVGTIGPEDLLAALDWSERVHREATLTLGDRHKIVANWHGLRVADPRAIGKLPKVAAKQAPDRKEKLAESELRSLVSAAWDVRGRQLLSRFGDNFAAKDRNAMLLEWAKHGEPRTDFPHLVLSRQPLIPIGNLQRAIAEICLQSEFWEVSPRRGEVAAWATEQHRQNRSVLLIVHSNSESEQFNNRKLNDVSWRAHSDQLNAVVDRAAVAEITASELATLVQDHRRDPQAFATRQALRFVVVDGTGSIAAVLDEKADESAVARVLSRLTNGPFVAGSDTKPRARPEVNP